MQFRVAGIAVLLTGLVGAVALAQSSDVVNTYDAVIAKYGDGLKENLRIRFWHDEYTGGRAPKKFYPSTWDLRELPDYAPKRQLSGTLRISGYYLIRGQVGKLWVEGFTKFHPQVKVVTSETRHLPRGAVHIITA